MMRSLLILSFWLPFARAEVDVAAQRAIREYVAAVQKVQPKRNDMGEIQAKISALTLQIKTLEGRAVRESSAQQQIDLLNKSIAEWSSPQMKAFNPYVNGERLRRVIGHVGQRCCRFYEDPDAGRQALKEYLDKMAAPKAGGV